ncbi:MAG TPA: hypothetical protein GYA07_11165 [Verrucomicrobia bacterium]|nr:hypothetical protein [Verrucomicrobiota bacterium]HOP99020.1 hypothetical protein [Verrucomicrobiota bacterium]
MKVHFAAATAAFLFSIALTAHTLGAPVVLLSEHYEISAQFSDRYTGVSNSFLAVEDQPVSGSVGYTSYYEDAEGTYGYYNSWSASGSAFRLSITGEAGLEDGGNSPYGTMDAFASWLFAPIDYGPLALAMNISVENTYLDEQDYGAISLSLMRNGAVWSQASLHAFPGLTPNIWETTLIHEPGDVWLLSVHITEAAWDFDYVRIDTAANLTAIPTAIPESRHLALFLTGGFLLLRLSRREVAR